MTACPPISKKSTPWASNNLHRSIQSGSIGVVVANPEGMELGARAQALLHRHARPFGELELAGCFVTPDDLSETHGPEDLSTLPALERLAIGS
jgi:hypothetical protein